MGRRSNYRKALARLTETGETQPTVTDAYMAMMEWLDGVPWRDMSPEGRENFMEKVVEEAFKQVRDWWLGVLKRNAKRVYPSFVKVWRYIMETYFDYGRWPRLLEEYEEHRTRLYREIARQLGLSWRTVRDAFWAARDILGLQR